jgi:oxygen-independent coproporphyrinogen-3 oxidase
MDELHRFFVWDGAAEVTIEANPEDVTAEAVSAWRRAGINRLSLGSQSFDNDVLQWMHRTHDAAGIRRAVEIARAEGITSLSLDLIFAMPRDVPRHWGADLEATLACGPDHVSLYGLTVEPHTPLGRWHARGEVAEADEERYAAEFLEAHATLAAAGFEHYEVSNFALAGRRARHNSAYWRGVPYLGLGPSAHGFDGHSRRWNTAAYAAWEAQLLEGRDPCEGQEELTAANQLAESVYLGLRTTDGLPVDAEVARYVQPWVDAGWIETRSVGEITHAVCTPDGWLRLDALAADLTAFRSPP